MLLSKSNEFGVRVGEALSPPPISRRRPARLGSFGIGRRTAAGGGSPGGRSGDGDYRIRLAAGDLWPRLNGVEGREPVGHIGGFSHESEHDLALMVSDFLENEGGAMDSRCSSDSDSGFPDLAHLAEKVLLCKRAVDQHESDLLSVVQSLLLSIEGSHLHGAKKDQCNSSCIRHSLVRLLKFAGYDAAVCTVRWQGIDKVPGGDHEYIDLIINDDNGASERLIIDIDFRSHFEIARATESYGALLDTLPVIYVGTLPRLEQFLQVMVDAAKCSLKQNSMPLPPWRSLAYLQAKWRSKHERRSIPAAEWELHGPGYEHKQCHGHLMRLKSLMQSDIEAELLLKPLINDKKWRGKIEKRRLSLLIY